MLPERITDLQDDELLDLSKSIDKDFFKLNFSLTDFSSHFIHYSNRYLIKQSQITEDSKDGICLITSLFNAYHKELFDDSVDKVRDIIEKLVDDISLSRIMNEFYLVLDKIDISKCINEDNAPCICCFRKASDEKALGHAVAVFGEDDLYCYYFENAGTDVLSKNTIESKYEALKKIFKNGTPREVFEKEYRIPYAYDFMLQYNSKQISDEKFRKNMAVLLSRNTIIKRGNLTVVDKKVFKSSVENIKCVSYKDCEEQDFSDLNIDDRYDGKPQYLDW